MTESEQLIELIGQQTVLLLKNHWPDILDFRDGTEIKIAFSHALEFNGQQRTVKTKISFARRVSDEIEESINTAQAELPISERSKRQ